METIRQQSDHFDPEQNPVSHTRADVGMSTTLHQTSYFGTIIPAQLQLRTQHLTLLSWNLQGLAVA